MENLPYCPPYCLMWMVDSLCGSHGWDNPRNESIHLVLSPDLAIVRSEQWTRPTRKPDRPNSNRQVLGGFENIQVGFWVLFLGYFRVRVSVGSYKYSSLNPNFFFWLKKTLLFSPPSALSLFLKPHPYKPSPFTQFKALSLCKS